MSKEREDVEYERRRDMEIEEKARRQKQMEENMKLRGAVQEMGETIAGDIHHGECFYDKEMLDEFLANLEEMKSLAQAYYESNQEDREDE